MALIDIMNEDGTLDHGSGSPISGGSFVIVSVASIKNQLNGKGIFRDDLEYSFSGGSASGVVAGTVRTVVNQDISPTAVFTKADGFEVIREGDSGTMNAVGDNPSPPPPTLPVSGPVEVATAGQNKGKGQ